MYIKAITCRILRPKQYGRYFTDDILKLILFKVTIFLMKFHWNLFVWVQLTIRGLCSGRGMEPNRWKVITWTNWPWATTLASRRSHSELTVLSNVTTDPCWLVLKQMYKLEQLECLRSEDTRRRPMITHTIDQFVLNPTSKQDKVKNTNLNVRKLRILNCDKILIHDTPSVVAWWDV